MPYFINHALIALAITTVVFAIGKFIPNPVMFLSCAVGVAFYAGREYVQWEKYEPSFDWPGLLAPLIAMLIVYIVYTKVN